MSFTTVQTLKDLFKGTLRYRDGSRSVKLIRNHFSGEINSTRNIAKSERIHNSLLYNNESFMASEPFLTKCQNMYNIFEEEGEPMEEDAKIFLFLN